MAKDGRRVSVHAPALSSSISTVLRSDRTAALAALMVIAIAHRSGRSVTRFFLGRKSAGSTTHC
jgi:hypothetical protein